MKEYQQVLGGRKKMRVRDGHINNYDHNLARVIIFQSFLIDSQLIVRIKSEQDRTR